MSPFWKNVDEEIKYLNMNLKTLAKLSGVPYPTITNGRNRENSIPEIETARKIANALHKPLNELLGIDNSKNQNINSLSEEMRTQSFYLYQKYLDVINIMEEFPPSLRESIRNVLQKLYDSYKVIKKE